MKRIFIALGSLVVPLLFFILVATGIWLSFVVKPDEEIPVHLRPVVVAGLITLFVTVVGTWVMIIVDIVHVAKNTQLSRGARAGWIFAIWFLNVFAIPVYWCKHLRLETEAGNNGNK